MSAIYSESKRTRAVILQMSIEQRLALLVQLYEYHNGPLSEAMASSAQLPESLGGIGCDPSPAATTRG